jgi:hypothetical protein
VPIAAEDSLRRSTLAGFAGGFAGLVGQLAGVAHLGPDPCAEWVNWSAACEKVVAVDCAALVRPVRAIGALADGRAWPPWLRRRRRPNWRALELADHRASSSSSSSRFPGRIAVELPAQRRT